MDTTIACQMKTECSEISIKQFLDFLRTAYQVTDTVEDILSTAEGTTDIVNWIKLKNTELVKPKSISAQTSSSNIEKSATSETAIKSKLDEVLNEGVLDSVLPYLVPNANKKSSTKLSDKSSTSGSTKSSSSKDSLGRRKSTDSVNKIEKTNSEVEIHVCDEVKNIKKDFVCSQKLLVEKMGYFAEVTSGQTLSDMDISVHCDIGIFEWLMRWVKQELIPEEDWPKLDAQCVIPILVSAAFLQMDPLLQDCLLFCHENMNDILQTATNLNCLNDSIITRLAAMYTNSELEAIKDKKDKIQSRLYCKMIISLCDPVSESVRGHWNSLSRIYKCSKCEQLIMPEIAKSLPCHPSCMSLNRFGQLTSQHVKAHNWSINEYVTSLHSQLKTWRKVYWHLWGDCHYLFCTVCMKPFPAHKYKWCCYHADSPQFFTVDSQKSPLPVGSCMSLNRFGQLTSQHVKAHNWSINEYVTSLHSQLKTWRKVYWHLWGDCHYLFCTVCMKPFPAHKYKWCCYHADSPQFFTVDSQKSPLPVGRYPCCGERAYKFQLLSNHSGCHFKQHIPKRIKARDAAVYAILEEFREVIDTEPPQLIFPERLTRLVARDASTSDGKLNCKEVFWWDGLQVLPPRHVCGLLGTFTPKQPEKSPPVESFDEVTSDDSYSPSMSSSSSARSEEEVAKIPKVSPKRKKMARKKAVGKLWQLNLSARSNQDLQRANEEVVLSKMVTCLSKKSALEPHTRHKGFLRHLTPPGGIYTRLEHDWKESSAPTSLRRIFNKNNTKIRAMRLV